MRIRRLVRVAALVAQSVVLGLLLVATLAISILNETNGRIITSRPATTPNGPRRSSSAFTEPPCGRLSNAT